MKGEGFQIFKDSEEARPAVQSTVGIPKTFACFAHFLLKSKLITSQSCLKDRRQGASFQPKLTVIVDTTPKVSSMAFNA